MRYIVVIASALALALSGGTMIADSLTKSVGPTIQRYEFTLDATETTP